MKRQCRLKKKRIKRGDHDDCKEYLRQHPTESLDLAKRWRAIDRSHAQAVRLEWEPDPKVACDFDDEYWNRVQDEIDAHDALTNHDVFEWGGDGLNECDDLVLSKSRQEKI